MSSRWANDTGRWDLDSALGRLAADGYGENWSIAKKLKVLQKFGRDTSLALNTKELLWEVAETFETLLEVGDGNLIDTISSSDAGDVGDDITIEGHYFNGAGNLVFHIQTAVLNGQNKVTLAQPLARCSRMFDVDSALAGDVHVYQDTTISGGVPTDLAFAHNVIKGTAGEVQSFKAATTISYLDAFLITRARFSIQRKQSATVDFRLERALLGQAFRPFIGDITLNTTGQSAIEVNFDPPLVVPPNADIRAVATSNTAGVSANCVFSGYLAVKSPF